MLENRKEKSKDMENGITLIALVITIIVLLILAGVAIATLLGENGVLTKAISAKEATEIGQEQEYVNLAKTSAIQNSITTRGNAKFTQQELESELDKLTGGDDTDVTTKGSNYLVTFKDSKREYEVEIPNWSSADLDWEKILEEAKNDPSIEGIGTDGEPVDMSLWKYTEIEGGVGLFGGTEEKCSWSENGYLGECPSGNIVGRVPQYVRVNGEFKPVVSMESTFKGNAELVNLPEIPSTVTNIDSMCHNCKNLKTVTINSTVGNIGKYAFYGCDNLENVTIANGIRNIDENAFGSCDSLVKIQLPTSIENIGEDSFSYCTSLSEINLPEGLKSLYESFIGCESLTSIEIPTTLTNVYADKSLYSGAGEGPFEDCTNLKNVTFKEGSNEIAGFIFMNSEIENVYIPEGVKIIGNGLFRNCDYIRNIVLPQGIEEIRSEAFSSCDNLESIVIPNTVKTIGSSIIAYGNEPITINYTGTEEEWKKITKGSWNYFEDHNIVYNYVPESNN